MGRFKFSALKGIFFAERFFLGGGGGGSFPLCIP